MEAAMENSPVKEIETEGTVNNGQRVIMWSYCTSVATQLQGSLIPKFCMLTLV